MQGLAGRQSAQVAVRAFAVCLTIALIAFSAGPVHADAPEEQTATGVFECPPPTGIYPEPDPCVATPTPPKLPEILITLDQWPVAPDWYCEPKTKPGVTVVAGILRSTYDIGGSTTRPCDAPWSYEFSYHKMGLALDWRVDTSDSHGWAAGLSLIRWLLAPDSDGNEFAMARRIGITGLIWHNRVWSAHDPVWRAYCDPHHGSDDGCIDDATARHDDHMHIAFSLESGYLRTSFFDALGLKKLSIPQPPEPAVLDAQPAQDD